MHSGNLPVSSTLPLGSCEGKPSLVRTLKPPCMRISSRPALGTPRSYPVTSEGTGLVSLGGKDGGDSRPSGLVDVNRNDSCLEMTGAALGCGMNFLYPATLTDLSPVHSRAPSEELLLHRPQLSDRKLSKLPQPLTIHIMCSKLPNGHQLVKWV